MYIQKDLRKNIFFYGKTTDCANSIPNSKIRTQNTVKARAIDRRPRDDPTAPLPLRARTVSRRHSDATAPPVTTCYSTKN